MSCQGALLSDRIAEQRDIRGGHRSVGDTSAGSWESTVEWVLCIVCQPSCLVNRKDSDRGR